MDDKAKKRWQILAKVIKSKKPVTETTKRKFQTYNLIQTELVQTSSCCHEAKPRDTLPSSEGDTSSEDDITCLHTWHRVHCLLLPDLRLQVRLFKSSVSLSDLVGFNNTGNVCIWPSEECLAFYCLHNRNQFSGSRVLELGGGMTCLAGLLLAAANVAAEVRLTDGNSNAAGNLLDMLEGEKVEVGGDTKVTAAMLRWDDWEALKPLKASFDWVICADCLFFDSGREGLGDRAGERTGRHYPRGPDQGDHPEGQGPGPRLCQEGAPRQDPDIPRAPTKHVNYALITTITRKFLCELQELRVNCYLVISVNKSTNDLVYRNIYM